MRSTNGRSEDEIDAFISEIIRYIKKRDPDLSRILDVVYSIVRRDKDTLLQILLMEIKKRVMEHAWKIRS